MTDALLPVLTSGFLMGWSVAWPPGPINTEIARRCLARGFWAGFSLLLGACSGDALWALLVALGVGIIFTGAKAQLFMGILSIFLLAVLMVTFLRRAWQGWRRPHVPNDSVKFDSTKASYVLGATMALTSPWNITFWLAAVGRPGMSDLGLPALLLTVAAVIGGAAAWGLVWSATVVIAHRRVGAGGRWGAVVLNIATAMLMLWFIIEAVMRLRA